MATMNFNQSACVRLDVSIWTARAKLRREDIPNAADLPPEALASLGSKRLFDPVKLRVFNTLKARAISLLDRHGCRFLGGWCVRADLLDKLDRELSAIQTDFTDALHDFIHMYEHEVDRWFDQFPDWRHILAPALPTVGELNRRFGFSWQMYRIVPEETQSIGNNLSTTIMGLADRALEEVIRMAKETYEECFKDKTTVTKKAFRPVHTMLQKLDTLSYLHPTLNGLRGVLQEALTVAELTPGDASTVRNFQMFLLSLQAPAVVAEVISRYNDGVIHAGEAFDALLFTVSAPTEGQPSELVHPVEKAQPSQPLVQHEKVVLENANNKHSSGGQTEDGEIPTDPVGAVFDMF